jgi:GNAT superfamily N-acetyltransferase
MDVRPLTRQRLSDLDELFATTAMTNRCYCTYFLLTSREREHVWPAGRSRAVFEEAVAAGPVPGGVLAYRDGRAVGWCAAGPRVRYGTVMRSPLWKERDVGEDESVWLVPCFYVHREARHTGLTVALLDRAVALAREYGAAAIEGMPRADGAVGSGATTSFVGFPQTFADCGFTVRGRPSTQRLLMRRDLR